MARRSQNKSKWKRNLIAVLLAIGAALYGLRDRLPTSTVVSRPPSGYDHDKWQTKPYDIKRTFKAFVVSFDSEDDDDGDGKSDLRGQPEFVAYQINRYEGELGKGAKRPGSWSTDKALAKKGVAPTDATYRNGGYDRGHMCMKYHAFRMGADADRETHTVLNACPQTHKFNGGIWLDLEQKCEKWADKFGVIWIVCGPVFEKGKPVEMVGDAGEMKIPIPHAFYKIVIRQEGDGIAVLAFMYPHKDIGKSLFSRKYDHSKYLVTVDEVEEATGLDFLTVLPDEQEDAVEAAKAKKVWQ